MLTCICSLRLDEERKCLKGWKNFVQVNEQCCFWKDNEKSCKQRKRQHKVESNPNYMTEKMFDNDLVKICRSQVLKYQHILKFVFGFDI